MLVKTSFSIGGNEVQGGCKEDTVFGKLDDYVEIFSLLRGR